jgi:hypothetical protein
MIPRSQLESQLHVVAAEFVQSLIAAIRGASVAELSALARVEAAPPALAASRPAARRDARPAAQPARGARNTGATTRARRAGRRPSDEIHALEARVIELVKGSAGGLSISDIASRLGVPKGDLPRPLALAVAAGLVKKTGEKRLSRYFPGRAKKG